MRKFEGEARFSNDSPMEDRKIALRIARAKARAIANRVFWWWMALATVWLASIALARPQEAQRQSRIKDVATIEGIRDNQLVGYGLVVGLRGTGDSSQTVFPAQTLVSALQRMGVTVPQSGSQSASNMQVKNMAGVFVVATLPPFSRPGYKVDITVSSAGDARSLEGGILLMTPLYGVDGQIYAQAQGALVLGGYMATGGGNSKQVNHPTTARIPGGSLVERAVPYDLADMRTVSVVLNDADFHTAEGMAAAIDRELGVPRAHASRRVEIAREPKEDTAALLDKVEQVEISVYPRARVVVNERNGTVVIGGTVRLLPVSILHGGLSVKVISRVEGAGAGGALSELASEELGQSLSQRGGLGIANRIIKELSHTGNQGGSGKVLKNLHQGHG
jgi:flagellar P-ring protein precursor FlgI